MEKKMETTIMGDIGLGFRRNGKDNGNHHNGLKRNYCKDPFLHAELTKGQSFVCSASKVGKLNPQGDGLPVIRLDQKWPHQIYALP